MVDLFVSLVVLVGAALTHPTVARCPHGWVVAGGVRRSGSFVCRPDLVGEENDPVQPPGAIAGRVYCSPGFEPAQTRYGDVVRCQRKPGT